MWDLTGFGGMNRTELQRFIYKQVMDVKIFIYLFQTRSKDC